MINISILIHLESTDIKWKFICFSHDRKFIRHFNSRSAKTNHNTMAHILFFGEYKVGRVCFTPVTVCKFGQCAYSVLL